MSTFDQMRSQLVQVYPGEHWRNRVACMADRQVVAIYKSLKKRGELRKHKKKKPYEKAVQLTIWDFIK